MRVSIKGGVFWLGRIKIRWHYQVVWSTIPMLYINKTYISWEKSFDNSSLFVTRARLASPNQIQERRWMPFLELKWPKDLESQGRWPPFSILPKIIPRCIFGANCFVLAQICGQAKFPRILSQKGKKDLEDQSQWPPFSKPVESNPGCMFGANFVIPISICDELSCGQAEFPRNLSQMVKMNLKITVNDLNF